MQNNAVPLPPRSGTTCFLPAVTVCPCFYPIAIKQTWILMQTKCNELKGCTQTDTRAPRTCNNSLCSAKSDHPHLLQTANWSSPSGWMSSASALSQAPSTLQFGRNYGKWQTVRKTAFGWEIHGYHIRDCLCSKPWLNRCAFCHQWTKNWAHSWCVLLQLVTAKCFLFSVWSFCLSATFYVSSIEKKASQSRHNNLLCISTIVETADEMSEH